MMDGSRANPDAPREHGVQGDQSGRGGRSEHGDQGERSEHGDDGAASSPLVKAS